jgi:hypothetical protein
MLLCTQQWLDASTPESLEQRRLVRKLSDPDLPAQNPPASQEQEERASALMQQLLEYQDALDEVRRRRCRWRRCRRAVCALPELNARVSGRWMACLVIARPYVARS